MLTAGTLLVLGSMVGGCASRAERAILPGAAHHGRVEAIVQPNAHYQLLSLQVQDRKKIAAEFGTALDAEGRSLWAAKPRPPMLFFYGNGTYMTACQGLFEGLRRLGINVLIPEYPGSGMSEGRTDERGCYAGADAAYDYLSELTSIRAIPKNHTRDSQRP